MVAYADGLEKFFMIWYHLIFSDNKKAVGYAWNLMGFVAKLAQGVIKNYFIFTTAFL